MKEAKKYYIKHFNRINRSVGSSLFSNIFNQKEVEEDFQVDDKIENLMNDSDDNKKYLSSEELLLGK